MKPLVLVTGDIVLDCHLYGGVKTAATSFSEPGTTYQQHLGGAALTHRLLRASADIAGKDWDQKRAAWEATNTERQNKSLAALPDDLPKNRPASLFDVHLGLAASGLELSLPGQLRSYGVWSDRLARKGSTERVWRCDRHYGYGPTEPIARDGVFKPNSAGPSSQPSDESHRTVDPVLTVIDDGGILFRQESARAVWPTLSADSTSHFLLKMSSPLCRGDLWPALKPVMDRLIVVVSSADLRREDAQITQRLSWEECAGSTLRALEQDSTLRELLNAAHVIVNFRSGGALWIARGANAQRAVRLIFDPVRLEEDFDRDFDGTVYGFQTCVVVGIAHHLMAQHAKSNAQPNDRSSSPFSDASVMVRALESGIFAGLQTHRRLLELGHGTVKPASPAVPGLPVEDLAVAAATSAGGFIAVDVPSDVHEPQPYPWTVLARAELVESPTTPLIGVAHLTARYGLDALSHVPALKLGRLFTVDRSEIESLRTLDALIRDYESVKVQKKPLCIGVFGPPGSGKSFGVQALAEGILGDKAPFLEFNLSQFKGPDDLIGAFHRVRDAVLKGITPVAFWDEFDSQHYTWLQYLLAPMQDGAFQEGQVTHPIGKCVFVFAGGTSDTLQEFGVAAPQELSKEALAELSPEAPASRKIEEDAYREFKRLKGPDFISRLHGFLNVLGTNPRNGTECPDITWPIRRALILRSILKLKDREELDIDLGLLYALLSTPIYRHGARSLEKIVVALVSGRDNGRLHRAALPPDPTLDRETDAAQFRSKMEHSRFKNYPDIEKLAAAVHVSFLDGARKAAVEAEIAKCPEHAWKVHPAVMKDYEELSADLKASNRAAARRVPEHLLLINFIVKPQEQDDDRSWVKPLTDAIEKHIDRLARAEHLGWCAERRANGWSFARERNNDRKHHPLLVDWSELTPSDRESVPEQIY